MNQQDEHKLFDELMACAYSEPKIQARLNKWYRKHVLLFGHDWCQSHEDVKYSESRADYDIFKCRATGLQMMDSIMENDLLGKTIEYYPSLYIAKRTSLTLYILVNDSSELNKEKQDV